MQNSSDDKMISLLEKIALTLVYLKRKVHTLEILIVVLMYNNVFSFLKQIGTPKYLILILSITCGSCLLFELFKTE